MPLALISFFCPDRTGLVASVTGRLFEMGVNLGDTSFAVLGSGAEFSSVSEVPFALTFGEIETELKRLPELKGGKVTVMPFELDPSHGPMGKITHRIVVAGGDRPGLVARLSEVFGSYGANIVTLNAEHLPGPDGGRYIIRFGVNIPPARVNVCLATIANTAEELQQTVNWEG
jgi:glycine cleavage system transcriptional repressor